MQSAKHQSKPCSSNPNFLKDPAEYAQAEALWRDQWAKLLRSTKTKDKWKSPWINTTHADGSPFQDGNPIFSAVCRARRRGIRVVLHKPRANSSEYTFWTDTFAKGEPEEIQELVIACLLTPDALQDSLDLMQKWVLGKELAVPRSRKAKALHPRRTG